MHACVFCIILIFAASTSPVVSYEGASRKEFDILEDVARTHMLRTTYGGPSQEKSYYLANDKGRNLKVSNRLLTQITPELASGRDFTFLVTIRQQPNNRGSLIAFTHQRRKRFLELQSVWHQHEYRYHHLFTLAATHVNTERLPYMPVDGRWHKIALSVSGTLLELRVDCRRVFSHRVPFPPPQREFLEPYRRIQLWLGQRGHRRSIFVGSISEAKIVVGDKGYQVQCPSQATVSTTILDSFKTVLGTLQQEIHVLKERLQVAEGRLQKLEQCDCKRSCGIGDKRIQDGDTFKNGSCSTCTCINGQLNCTATVCPTLICKFPVWPENSCCPICLNTSSGRSCRFRGISYEHGESRYRKSHDKKVCVVCTCYDGGMKCRQYNDFTQLCPKLTCKKSEQFTTENDCCPFCPGMDFCSSGHRCHRDASCINLATRYGCRCKSGYSGNGYQCEDIDECELSVNSCGYNSRCYNLKGSYQCKCANGFEIGKYGLCEDINECRNSSSCPSLSECKNLVGSYECVCQNGYKMTDKKCVPQCATCFNGGICIGPDTCSCPFGFFGNFCQKDVDECHLGIHGCSENETCHNIPGSYFCQCRKGYSSTDNNIDVCTDVNECTGKAGMSFTCGPETICNNTVGSYECICKDSLSCLKGCVVAASIHKRSGIPHGTLLDDTHDPCKECLCKKGVLTCQKKMCDCSKSEDEFCCPECLKAKCNDEILNRTYDSGQRWTVNCKECFCFNGTKSCAPIKCQSTRWCRGATIMPKGHCCPMCLNSRRSTCLQLSISSEKLLTSCNNISKTIQSKIEREPCLHCRCKENSICCTQRIGCNSSESLP